jgi:hypothetical protein
LPYCVALPVRPAIPLNRAQAYRRPPDGLGPQSSNFFICSNKVSVSSSVSFTAINVDSRPRQASAPSVVL